MILLLADPDVRIARIYCSVRTSGKNALLPFFLSTSARSTTKRSSSGGTVTITTEFHPDFTLRLRPVTHEGGTTCDVEMNGHELGEGKAGFAKVGESLAQAKVRGSVEIDAPPDVSWKLLVRAIDVADGAGMKSFLFKATFHRRSPALRLPGSIKARIDLPGVEHAVDLKSGLAPLEVGIGHVSQLAPKKVRIFADGSFFRGLDAFTGDLGFLSGTHINPDSRQGASLLPVVVFADRGLSWKQVKWLLMACTDPEHPVYRTYLAVAQGGGVKVLPVWMPTKRLPPGSACLTVKLSRGAPATSFGEGEVEVKLHGTLLGKGAAGLKALEKALGQIHERHPKEVIHGEIDAALDVPYADVVGVVDVMRGIGIRDFRFLND